jgi:hypothetical protein
LHAGEVEWPAIGLRDRQRLLKQHEGAVVESDQRRGAGHVQRQPRGQGADVGFSAGVDVCDGVGVTTAVQCRLDHVHHCPKRCRDVRSERPCWGD